MADAYDTLTSKRVFKDAYSLERTLNMILNGDCGAFSPKVLECFKQVSGKFEQLAQSYADGCSPKADNFDVTLPGPVQQADQNTLQAVQAKYQSMLHYANATVAEVDLDQGLFHLVYNPDPNLTLLRPNVSFEDLQQTIMDHIILPEERPRFQALIYEEIPKFFQGGHHRQSYYFHVQSRVSDYPETYEVTLLRLDPSNLERRRMIIIWRKAEARHLPPAPTLQSPFVSENTPYRRLVETCCCCNDTNLTLATGQEEISRLVGYSPAELRDNFQNHLIELVAPQDQPILRQKFNEQLSCGNDVELTYRLRHKDGRILWVLHKCQLVCSEDGCEYLYNSALLDITRAKNAQEDYNMTLEQYQIILSQTGNIVFE